jgi:hypothetical protein
MRHFPTIAGILLGLLFVVAGATYLLGLVPKMDPPPAGSLPALFMGAFAPSGYLAFVKVLELLGGVLIGIPRTRVLGLLVLGPILVNIIAFHIFIMRGATLLDPMLVIVVLLALYLLWVERSPFAQLLRRPS